MAIKIKGILKVVGKIADGALLGGVFQNKNSEAPDSPVGHTDKVKLIGGVVSSIALLVLIYLLATDKISFDEFQQGVESIQ